MTIAAIEPIGGRRTRGDLYAAFMVSGTVPSRGFTLQRAKPALWKGWCPMGDFISIAVGLAIFALLIIYVPACEKV
jgi:hypothetical protein